MIDVEAFVWNARMYHEKNKDRTAPHITDYAFGVVRNKRQLYVVLGRQDSYATRSNRGA
jgi:hypothetical protein